jgi:hypothetical protein
MSLGAPALYRSGKLQGVMAEFAQCIRSGRASRTDGRSGLRVLTSSTAASRSLEFQWLRHAPARAEIAAL